jgi:hypothetical protein
MRTQLPLLSLLLALAPLTLTACLATSGDDPESAGTFEAKVLSANSLSYNGLVSNGLTSNGLTSNGLTSNGLTSNGLTSNGLVMDALSDTLTQTFFSYVVGCALPGNQSITIPINSNPVIFAGSLGLAPEWGVADGQCSATCQALVSACVLARVNAQGHHIPLSLRGTGTALEADSTEQSAYPLREGAYFGDIFGSGPRLACSTRDSTLINRVVGPVANRGSSPIKVVADCEDVCDTFESPTAGAYYVNCHDDLASVSTRALFPSVITVYRQNSDQDNP